MPPILDGDRDDTPDASWYIHWDLPEPRTSWLKANDQLRPLVRAYLACVSFVDSQVGRVLDAVEKSPFADNTIVVLWSDHGYHLGEKAISGKNSLWTRSTRVPLIIAGPGVPIAQTCNQPAELLDLYPTLSEMVGIPSPRDWRVSALAHKSSTLRPPASDRRSARTTRATTRPVISVGDTFATPTGARSCTTARRTRRKLEISCLATRSA